MGTLPQCLAWSALYAELSFKLGNLCRLSYLVFDSLFGLVVLGLAMARWTDIFVRFWTAVHLYIKQLETLITWLTNNPAGLKLNDALNTFLSNFFFYHIHIWRTYVTFFEHSWTKWLLIASGALGLSVLVAFLSDFLRVLTVHIFCFHIYTQKLAKVCWAAFLGVSRAFRSKKWNPLRERVDSVKLDSRQLFITTLAMIILLFLMPTICVYFGVFSTLWLSVDGACRLLRRAARMIRQTLAHNWDSND
uniref:Phosphatidylinositol N-acetylglucosaminyltransferase subunit Q n=1 Tax=Globodera rostochiensis TaxID=31243 RepID=A0A914IC60_GLORO